MGSATQNVAKIRMWLSNRGNEISCVMSIKIWLVCFLFYELGSGWPHKITGWYLHIQNQTYFWNLVTCFLGSCLFRFHTHSPFSPVSLIFGIFPKHQAKRLRGLFQSTAVWSKSIGFLLHSLHQNVFQVYPKFKYKKPPKTKKP